MKASMKAILAEAYKSIKKAKIKRDVKAIKSEFTNMTTVMRGDNDNAKAK